MRYLFLAALLIGAVSAVVLHPPHLAPLLPLEESENVIPEEYIVIFKKTASELDVQRHMIFLNNMFEFINGTYQVQHVYDMGPDLRGYAAIMNEQMLYSVRGMQEVDYVEKNQLGEWGDTDNLKNFQWPDSEDEDESAEFDQHEVEDTDEVEDQEESEEEDLEEPADDESELDDEDDDDDDEKLRKCKVQKLTNANWALSRISHKKIQRRRLRYRYRRNRSYQGKGVKIYIIDSGIDVKNPDFGGRAKWGINLSGRPKIDRVGHGTNVAGCAMSNTYGVAKRATAIAVGIARNGNGRPDTDLAIRAFQWVQRNQKKRKAIANGSFSVGKAANAAAEALVKSGVPVVIAAGNTLNGGADACLNHPASSKKVITVAASDRNDNFATFSHFGKCVNLIAPGVDIQTTGKNNNNPTTTSGTSFSSPYTCGVLATIMGKRRRTSPRTALRLLRRRALRRKIKNVPRGTPNCLLNSRCR